MKYYTGIGSRSTPEHILKLMSKIGKYLALKGYALRSGGANGADTAFEIGCDEGKGIKEIFIPWERFNDRINAIVPNITPEIYKEVAEIHSAWDKCSYGARKLHCRNYFQVNGIGGEPMSSFVICWTPSGKEVGGTAMAIRLAKKRGIPVINLANQTALKEFVQLLKEEEQNDN